MPFTRANRATTVSIVAIIASIFVIGLGLQFAFAQRQDNEQDKADDAYADCLTGFAADLVSTLKVRGKATRKLLEAGERKDKALDQLIVISAKAQASGAQEQADLPPGLLRRYERVLNERVAAQKAYNRLKADAEDARKANPYVAPKVVCQR